MVGATPEGMGHHSLQSMTLNARINVLMHFISIY